MSFWSVGPEYALWSRARASPLMARRSYDKCQVTTADGAAMVVDARQFWEV